MIEKIKKNYINNEKKKNMEKPLTTDSVTYLTMFISNALRIVSNANTEE